jgi:hypothetical protein
MLTGPLAADDRPWTDIPGVAVVGIFMGLGFIIVAIRYIIRKK